MTISDDEIRNGIGENLSLGFVTGGPDDYCLTAKGKAYVEIVMVGKLTNPDEIFAAGWNAALPQHFMDLVARAVAAESALAEARARAERDAAVIEAAIDLRDNSPVDDDGRPYVSDTAGREFHALLAALAARVAGDG